MFKVTRSHIARAIALIWAANWVFFAVASETAEPVSFGQKAFVCLLATTIFLGSAVVPWRYERIGGLLLLVEGTVLCIANYAFLSNPPVTQVFLLLALALPPLLAGILFLTSRPRSCSLPG